MDSSLHPLLWLLSHAFFFVYACLCVLLYAQFIEILLLLFFLPRAMHFPQLFIFLRFSRSLPVSFHGIFVVVLFLLTIPPPDSTHTEPKPNQKAAAPLLLTWPRPFVHESVIYIDLYMCVCGSRVIKLNLKVLSAQISTSLLGVKFNSSVVGWDFL